MARMTVILLLVLMLAPAATAEPLHQARSIHDWIGALWAWLFAWVGTCTALLPPANELGPYMLPDGVQAPGGNTANELGPYMLPDGVQAEPATGRDSLNG